MPDGVKDVEECAGAGEAQSWRDVAQQCCVARDDAVGSRDHREIDEVAIVIVRRRRRVCERIPMTLPSISDELHDHRRLIKAEPFADSRPCADGRQFIQELR